MPTSQAALLVKLIEQQGEIIARVEHGVEEVSRKLDVHGEDIQCLKIKVDHIEGRVESVEQKPREQRQSAYVWIAIIGGALGLLGMLWDKLSRLFGGR